MPHSPPNRSPLRLSVAMCTYNGEKYLPEQLASIGRQTVQPFEMVVRDDGSTDRTIGILEAFAAQCGYPVRIGVNEKNLHFTGNFLKAAAECTGDLVVFADQDDVWEATKLAEIDAAAAREEADLYLHEGVVIDGLGVPTGARLPDHAQLRADPDSPPYHQGAKGFAMAARRSVIGEILENWDWETYFAFRQKFGAPLGHDQLVYAWCIGRRIALISRPLVRYRIHESNVTASQTLTGNWLVRLKRKAGLIQFADFNYRRMADKSAAEVAFMDRMFPRQPAGLEKLGAYLDEMARLWGARADVHDANATAGQRWRSLYGFWRLNRRVRLVPRFGRAAMAKDLALTLLNSVARSRPARPS
jgi:glycosyltransferase involved in cell wall biosynthesis